jgi:phospholipid-translocating ATPase
MENEMTEKIMKNVNQFAKEGLRVLLLGKKEIEFEEYKKFKKEFDEAKNIMGSEGDLRVEAIQNKMETGLSIIGATAIEDLLQNNVKETIQVIR